VVEAAARSRDAARLGPCVTSVLGWTKFDAGRDIGGIVTPEDEVDHLVDVRDKPGFLHYIMAEVAGDARISLEGDLSQCQFPEEMIIARDENPPLRRMTLVPRQDFVILRLTRDTVAPIFQQVLRAGLTRAIIHVQIERGGVLELGAYDNFHPECTVTGAGILPTTLAALKAKSIVRDFTVFAPEGGESS
jgi:hypothetical protein